MENKGLERVRRGSSVNDTTLLDYNISFRHKNINSSLFSSPVRNPLVFGNDEMKDCQVLSHEFRDAATLPLSGLFPFGLERSTQQQF